MAQTHKSRIYQSGYDRGTSIASWVDLPELGQKVDKDIDYIGIDSIKTKDDACEYFMMMCYEAESNGREYSPFEFTAHELNEMDYSKPYDVWEIFEKGITDGISANWKSRKSYYNE